MNTYSNTSNFYIAKREAVNSNRWGVVCVSSPTNWTIRPSMTFVDASREAMRLSSQHNSNIPARFQPR